MSPPSSPSFPSPRRSKDSRHKTTKARDKSFSQHFLSPGLEVVLLRGTVSESSWAPDQRATAHRGQEGAAGAGEREGDQTPRRVPAPRKGARAPPETTGGSAGPGTRPVTFSCSSRSRATSGARSDAAAEPEAEAEAEAWGPGSSGASMAGAPGPQRGERVLNKCLWRRRGRRLPSARVLALMHCAPRAEEAAPAFSAAAAAATRVRAARGRISHAHAARRRRRRRRRGLQAAGGPVGAGGACPVAGPRRASCGGRASPAPPRKLRPSPRPARHAGKRELSLRPWPRPWVSHVVRDRRGWGRLSCGGL